MDAGHLLSVYGSRVPAAGEKLHCLHHFHEVQLLFA